METNYCSRCSRSFDKNLKFDFCPFCGRKLYEEGTLPELEDLTNCTLGEIFELWKNEHYPMISKISIRGYSFAWSKLEGLENYPIHDLKALHYQRIISKMVKEGYSRSSLEKVRNLISQLCKFAMKNDMIDKNYGYFLSLPKNERCTRTRFSDEELSILWQNTELEAVSIMLILAYTGLRPNELFNLKRDAVHPFDSIPYLVGGSKTEAGKNRTVIISPLIIDFVRNQFNKGMEYLIPSPKGGKTNLDNWRKRKYYPTLESLKLPKREIHCLRHTFASMMVKAGANQKSLTELMGHANITTTADIYAHADFEQLANAISLLKKPICPKNS